MAAFTDHSMKALEGQESAGYQFNSLLSTNSELSFSILPFWSIIMSLIMALSHKTLHVALPINARLR